MLCFLKTHGVLVYGYIRMKGLVVHNEQLVILGKIYTDVNFRRHLLHGWQLTPTGDRMKDL